MSSKLIVYGDTTKLYTSEILISKVSLFLLPSPSHDTYTSQAMLYSWDLW
ncbi:MAG: hypothetical protein ACOX2C_04775 [Bacteroidales bacterium]